MAVILIYVVFVLIGDSVAVAICSMVERFSESASLLAFFALFILVFWLAWRAALYVTERYLIRQS